MKELEKQYDPKIVEDKIYAFWEDNKYFQTVIDKNKKPFSIMMPPPNITGRLHMGHALDDTIQDILIRYKRMQGFSVLWVPGTDHASIATEAKIVEDMAKENLTKDDLGREKFLERAWEWKEKYGADIVNQLKKLGISCDWNKERFTLDEGCSKSVKEVFVNLYNKGLIYKGERLINWCPNCLTSISDAEVEFEEKDGNLFHIKYQVDGSGETLVLATTRPETLLGDTAIAVHPDDARYAHLIGKMVKLPLTKRLIPVIADTYVEMEFGTGVVKITPAHDPNDFLVGERHNLPMINILTENAHINENGGVYEGLERYVARKKIVEDLKDIGLLEKIEDRKHNVGTCYRCSTVVEPYMSNQWFVKMQELADPANEAVRGGEVKFIPQRFDKTYFHWMDNIKDWCISRQLWWGHRIPAFYCGDCGKITVSKEDTVNCCEHCQSTNIKQDEDTLDTWFSSALWPFSTLNWLEDSEEFKYFYPTSTLVTGYDIIFFWVARMIFSGIEHTGEVPFKDVFIHGIVRADDGRKMSKSLGNGIDPLEIIDLYGADALRFTLASGNTPGNDMRFSSDKVLASRNFANKLWNAARFLMMNLDDDMKPEIPKNLQLEDKWMLTKLNQVVKEMTDNLDKYELGLASAKIYEFTWDVYCDWYIELAKFRFQDENSAEVKSLMFYVFNCILKLLHPFMPFMTEEIYKSLPNNGDSIMVSNWCEYDENTVFEKETADFNKIIDTIKAIRNIRAEMNIENNKKSDIYIETSEKDLYLTNKNFILGLAKGKELFADSKFDVSNNVQIALDHCTVYLPMNDLIDKEKEILRLKKEKEKVEKDVKIISGKLNNPGFLQKAPDKLIKEEEEKLRVANDKLEKINQSLSLV